MSKEQHFIAAVIFTSLLTTSSVAMAQSADCQKPPSILEEALSDSAMPPVRNLGEVRFVSGGIGADEAAAMRAQRMQFPLAITFAERGPVHNGFVAGVYATISKPDGSTVLCAITRGPYLYVDLPAGTYRLAANAPGRTELVRTIKLVAGKHLDVALLWPPAPPRPPVEPIGPPPPPPVLTVPVEPAAPELPTPAPAPAAEPQASVPSEVPAQAPPPPFNP